MEEFNELSVLTRIQELQESRGWTIYKLASEADIPYSALRSMLKEHHTPTLRNLYKICSAFHITLSDFFTYCDDSSQDQVLELWNLLDAKSKELVLIYMKGLAKKAIIENENI